MWVEKIMSWSRGIEIAATVLFGFAIVHTFLCGYFRHWSHRFPEGSVKESFLHLLGEVEVVFGFWAGVLFLMMVIWVGSDRAIQYVESRDFTEPLFVFAIMVVAATRPIVGAAGKIIVLSARLLPLHREVGIYLCCLAIGPLLGSFITEPAAMTVVALVLRERYLRRNVSVRFKYLTLAALFVNVSIGGALTPYAAPPILMVAGKWNWDVAFMLTTFGWRVAIATLVNAAIGAALLSSELKALPMRERVQNMHAPLWLTGAHLTFLIVIVVTAHHPAVFLGAFLFFLGITTITAGYQDSLKIREGLLVSLFLSGLVVLGGLQSWWLEPLLHRLDAFPLFVGTTFLTAITDNAALTYLGSQVEGMTEHLKYALVAGAIAGGGLTVIANAPNPAGYSILQDTFGPDGIRPLKLFLFALPLTLITMTCLWIL
ncbi:MAG: putative Na+/H+ antiporter [Pseudomonadota bacterium]